MEILLLHTPGIYNKKIKKCMLLRLKIKTAKGSNKTIDIKISYMFPMTPLISKLSFLTKDDLTNVSKDLVLIDKVGKEYHYEFPMKRVNRIILLP